MRCQTSLCPNDAIAWVVKGGQALKLCSSCATWKIKSGWKLRDKPPKAPQG